MGRQLVNEFSWSKGRDRKLAECARAYFFNYYGSWGGWEKAAPERARRLYVLKKLDNRWQWSGAIVHDAIKAALLAVRRGRAVEPERLIATAHATMRRDFGRSAGRRYWQQGKARAGFFGLTEHEHQDGVSDEEWRTLWAKARASLEWFFGSRWTDLARSLQEAQWLEVDDDDFDKTVFRLEGVKVFAVPDFAYLEPDGTPVVVDWKNTRSRGGHDSQIIGYALYLSARYGFAPQSVRGRLVYLQDGTEVPVEMDPFALEAFRRHFADSVQRMRSLLADPEKNAPLDEAAFPMTTDMRTCDRCPFRRECGRAGDAS